MKLSSFNTSKTTWAFVQLRFCTFHKIVGNLKYPNKLNKIGNYKLNFPKLNWDETKSQKNKIA